MNNKGFMMAEVVVVSAIVLVFMTGMYASHNKVFTIYNQRVNYYDIDALYRLAYYRDKLLADTTKHNDRGNYIYEVIDSSIIDTNDKVYYVDSTSLTNVKKIGELSGVNATFKDYVDYLSTSLVIDTDKYDSIMIMESCDTEEVNCKYAYLEVLS